MYSAKITRIIEERDMEKKSESVRKKSEPRPERRQTLHSTHATGFWTGMGPSSPTKLITFFFVTFTDSSYRADRFTHFGSLPLCRKCLCIHTEVNHTRVHFQVNRNPCFKVQQGSRDQVTFYTC